ncbi:prolyl oligopeptidase family protein, partial [Vibrio parahaemolyticus V-223/04]
LEYAFFLDLLNKK